MTSHGRPLPLVGASDVIIHDVSRARDPDVLGAGAAARRPTARNAARLARARDTAPGRPVRCGAGRRLNVGGSRGRWLPGADVRRLGRWVGAKRCLGPALIGEMDLAWVD